MSTVSWVSSELKMLITFTKKKRKKCAVCPDLHLLPGLSSVKVPEDKTGRNTESQYIGSGGQ